MARAHPARATSVAAILAALACVHVSAAEEATLHRKTGGTIFIGSEPGQAPKASHAGPREPLDWLKLHGPAFGLADPAAETKVMRERVTERGRSTRFRQEHRGVPVFAGEVIVNVDPAGNLKSMTGRVAPGLDVDTTPALSSEDAAAIATDAVGKWHRTPAARLEATAPELTVYDPRLVDGSNGFAPSLAWRAEVRAKNLAPIDHLVLVDAHTGAILLHFNQVEAALSRSTYDTNSTSTLPGTLVCDESNPTCAGGIADAVSAHVNVADAYDYFLTQHGRDSYDGLGSPVVQTVRYCDPDEPCPYLNAFWSQASKQIVYGANYPKGDDIVAHEFAHAVQRAESSLFQHYQSGAINESLSDLWGELVDLTNGRGTDTGAVRWRIGEDVFATGIRNMADPPLKGDPDRMLSPLYATGADDNGGTHANAGINNKAVFLLVDGGTFNGRTVAALGMAKVAKIYYRAETALLTSGSDYLDLYNAVYQACVDLVGTDGITAGDCAQVRSATEAVEMHLRPASSFMPAATHCPAGQAIATTVLFDDLESGRANWTFQRPTPYTGGFWSWNTGYADSGVYSLIGPNSSVANDTRAATVNGYAIPAKAWLWFSHAFAFEHDGKGSYHDGGVLEYSVDSGTTWTDAGPLFAEGKGYGGTLSSPSANPIAGRAAFVAESHGYVSSRYDLASLAGQAVRWRFRIGSDASVNATGWRVDDFRIHTCAAEAATMAPLPASLAFGGQSMGTTSPALEVVIANTGLQPLTIASMTIANSQFTASGNCPAIAPGASCTVLVSFTPEIAPGALNSIATVTGSLVVASNSTTGTQAVALSGTGERSLVTHYYRSILRRAPDAGGKIYWEGEATRVAGLGASINETWFAMAQAFYSSAEYAAFARNNTAFATDLYNTFFNRAPDSGGLAFWVGQLDAGMPREVALASFMFSAEFASFTTAIFGNVAARAEVDAVIDFYRGILSRLPDNSGFAFWRDRFRAAQCQNAAAVTAEVEAISSAFALSTEYLARNRTNAQYVGDLYNAFLRRGGDLSGVQFWIGQLGSGAQTREQLRVQFRNSPEFQGRVNAIIAQGCL